jgi:hypothetical protein
MVLTESTALLPARSSCSIADNLRHGCLLDGDGRGIVAARIGDGGKVAVVGNQLAELILQRLDLIAGGIADAKIRLDQRMVAFGVGQLRPC